MSKNKNKKKRNDKKNRFNKINILIGVLGLLIMAISTVISIWAIRSNVDIARTSGAFDKAIPQLSISNFILKADTPTELVYGLPKINSAITFGRIPIIIKNIGQKISTCAIRKKYLISKG